MVFMRMEPTFPEVRSSRTMQVLVLAIMSMESTEASEVPEVVPRMETKVVWKEGLALRMTFSI
jgi:hypothetical protein